MKKLVFTLFLIGFIIHTKAQKNPNNQLGTWYMYNGSHGLSEKFSVKSMAHFRFFDLGDDMRQFVARVGLNYKITSNFSATLGYLYINRDNTFGLDGGAINESRIYEDFLYNHALNTLKFNHRIRIEQRFYNSTISYFYRYHLGLSYPIYKKWSAYLYDEIFFDFDGEAYFQNWIGGGFSYKASKSIKLKIGYQKITFNEGLNLDRILLGIVLNTSHYKKK